MKRVLLVTAALVAAVAVWTVVALPTRRRALDASWSDGTLAGIMHVHTRRSDGSSDPDTIAAAAARAGLKFLVFTDHGDGTRRPDPPTYRSGVLCLDGVEISTTGGHYVVLDMAAAPYPLGGEPRDVVEDVSRLGGFGIAAHPDSPKRELAWADWAPAVDGLEILNPDSSWRVHLYRGGIAAKLRVVSSLLTYPFRATETMGALLTDSSDAKAAWARETTTRQIVGVAGADAHARLALRDAEPGTTRIWLPLPGYEASFRVMSDHVFPSGEMTGDASVDAARLLAGIRHGRVFTAVDAWATPVRFQFTASAGGTTAHEGEVLAPVPPIRLQVRHNGGDAMETRVWRGAELASTHTGQELDIDVGAQPGVYRVEVRDPRHAAGPAWITSNPIYVRDPLAVVTRPAVERTPATAGDVPTLVLFDPRSTAGWTIESDRVSMSAFSIAPLVDGPALRVRYGLSGGADIGQFAGVARDTVGGVGSLGRVTFTVRGDRPMRLSLQVRADVAGAPPERWQRSVYVDTTDRTVSVPFDDMLPVGQTHTARAPHGTVRNIMFIVDTTNTAPGTSGNFWLKNVRVER